MDDWGATDFANCDIEIKEEPLDDPPDDAQEAESTEATLCFESVDVTSRDNLDYDAYPQACASYEDNLKDPLCDDSFLKSVIPSHDTHKTARHLSKDPFYHPLKVKQEPVSYETSSDFLDTGSKNINGSSVSSDALNEPIESVLKIKVEKPDADLHFEQPSGSCSIPNSLEPWEMNSFPPIMPLAPREEQQGILKVKETSVINNELQNSFLFFSAQRHSGKNVGELASQDSTLDQKDNKTLFLTYANNIHGNNPVHQSSLIIADTNLQTVNRKKSVYVPIKAFAENSPLRQAFGSYTKSKPMKHKTDILLLSKPKKPIQHIPSNTFQQKLIEQLPPAPPVLNHKSRKQILKPRVEISPQLKSKVKKQDEAPERKCFTTSSRRVLIRKINTNPCDLGKVKSRELLALQSWNWCKPKNIEDGGLSEPGCQVEQGKYSSDYSEVKEQPVAVKQELKGGLAEEFEDVYLADRLNTLSDKLTGPVESMKQKVESEQSVESNNSDCKPSVTKSTRKPRKQSLQAKRVMSRSSSANSLLETELSETEDTLYISCTECRRMFLHDHQYKAHLETFPHGYRSCQVCHEPCSNICSLQAHYVFHATDEGKSYCQLNKSDFHSKTLLLQYIQLFNSKRTGFFTCNCGKTFQWYYAFHRHIKQKFKFCRRKNVFSTLDRAAKRKEREENRERKEKMTSVITLPKCSTCDLEFYNRYDYLEHIRFAHLVMYTCDFCAYEVGNDKSAMHYHIKRHLDELEHLPSVS